MLIMYVSIVVAVFCFLYVLRYRKLKIITVIDGDTYIGVDLRGKKYRLRLKDIDCPEKTQAKGQEASEFAKAWLGTNRRTVVFRGRDKYRRYLVSISDSKGDLAVALVLAGLAHPLKNSIRLKFALFKAKITGKGIWDGTKVEMPWDSTSRNKGLIARLFKKLF